MVPDRTGRFRERPHYDARDLDVECEGIITSFAKGTLGGFSLPVPTDLPTKLIERDADDLDAYADLHRDAGWALLHAPGVPPRLPARV